LEKNQQLGTNQALAETSDTLCEGLRKGLTTLLHVVMPVLFSVEDVEDAGGA
jgi:hypothetical protein